MKRVVSISTVAFDGYPLPQAFEQIARIGARHVEVAYIRGYCDSFSDEVFQRANARRTSSQLKEAGLSCCTLSAHLDLGAAGAGEVFERRLEFACELGVGIIISNAAPEASSREFRTNIERLAASARGMGLTIALENPGDGRENLLDTGVKAARLVREMGLPNVALNYDFANLVTHLQDRLKPEEDFAAAFPHAVHLHIKDVKADSGGWTFPEIGKGSVDYRRLLSDPRVRALPLSLEVPLRLRRLPSGVPRRNPSPVPLQEISRVLSNSLAYVTGLLAS